MTLASVIACALCFYFVYALFSLATNLHTEEKKVKNHYPSKGRVKCKTFSFDNLVARVPLNTFSGYRRALAPPNGVQKDTTSAAVP